jgi:CelD/BcsL family acetyltransferase involved in cellulose biosynthesis
MRTSRIAGFLEIEGAWADLADRLQAPPSLHPGYVRAWLAAYSDPSRLRAGIVEEDGALVAVAPFVDAGRGRLTGMRQAEQWGVVATDDAAARDAILAGVSAARTSVLLRPVPTDDGTIGLLRDATRGAGGRMICRIVETHPLVEIGGDWDAYWAGIPQKRNLRRVRKRLEELGPVEVRTATEPGPELDAAVAAMVRIESSGWKARSGTSLAQRDDDRMFYEHLGRWAASRGLLRLDLLTAGGTPVAFAFDLVAYGVRYALKIGYDEGHARSSPGRVLLAEQIERAFADGLRRFDFAGAAADFKLLWANAERGYAEVVLFPRGAAGRATEAAVRAWWRVRPAAKALRRRIRERRAGA